MENKKYVEVEFRVQGKVELEISPETILELVADFNYLSGQYDYLQDKYESEICDNEDCERKRHGFGKK